ncbi:MAG: hypothetical protein M0R32_02515 [Candidatus Cloacimonetes bacterium]|jgi:hypothetical protein|nr:hypothetical protein [Candidatus Cloacimonadota bacterium]
MKDMTDKEYVKSGGNKCPGCRMQTVESEPGEFDDEGASRKCTCTNCGKTWIECLALVGYIQG